jgi:glyoxylase-like metal-dependent hydrolase (beta-lactamase superfamily II)
MLIRQLELGADKVFCYILACEESGEAVVIDPCGEEEKLLAAIDELQLKPLFIINTHCHPDHTCGNEVIKEATGASIVRHAADELLLQEPGAKEYFARHGFPSSPPADMIVKGGERLTFGKYALSIIHTPGHSPGSICIYVDNNLFTGDSLFVGAAGRVDVPGGVNPLPPKLPFCPMILKSGRGMIMATPKQVQWAGRKKKIHILAVNGR